MARRARVVLSPITLTMIGEQPHSRSAGWGRNIGAFALLFALVALLFHAYGAADTPSFLAAMLLALVAAALAILLSARAFSIIWMRGKRGLSEAALGLVYGALLWLVPLVLLLLASEQPYTTDVTTQGEPPAFLKIEGVRPQWAKPVGLESVMPSPLPRPLTTDASLEEVYEIVYSLILERDWDIVDERLPQDKNPKSAAIQAIERSFLGFTDDIVIRITAEDKQTRVNMRSASRLGPSDLGANAGRIDAFILALRQKLNER